MIIELLLVSGLGAHPAQTAGAVKAAATELLPELPAPADDGHPVRNTFAAIVGVAAAAAAVAAVRKKKGP